MEAIILYIITAIFILLWIYASVPKLWNLRYYHEVMRSQAIPRWSVSWIATLLPLTELAAAVLLLLPATRLIGMSLSLLMMVVFTIYISGIIFRVYDRYPCPCGGLFNKMGWRRHLKVNLLFTLIALAGLILLLQRF